MSNRSARRSQRRTGPRPSNTGSRRSGLRLLVLVAVIGLVVLAVASVGGVGAPVATPTPSF